MRAAPYLAGESALQVCSYVGFPSGIDQPARRPPNNFAPDARSEHGDGLPVSTLVPDQPPNPAVCVAMRMRTLRILLPL